jgi:hypothetical protein
MRFEIKSTKPLSDSRASVPGPAAIAGETLGHQEKQYHVQECRTEKDRKRNEHLVIRPADATEAEASHHDADTKPLRKVFADKKFRTGADKTAG